MWLHRFLDRQFCKFLGVGLTTALVQFFTFYLMLDVFQIPRRISVSASYIIAVTFHFNANRIVTFQAGNRNFITRMVKYIIVVFLNCIITIIIVDTCVKILTLSPYIGLMASIGTTVLTGFLLMRFWVFKDITRK